jgi:hypothetical protein
MHPDLMSTERVRVLVFVSQLKTGGPKSLCAPIHCPVAKANNNATNMVFFCTRVSCNFVAAWT